MKEVYLFLLFYKKRDEGGEERKMIIKTIGGAAPNNKYEIFTSTCLQHDYDYFFIDRGS